MILPSTAWQRLRGSMAADNLKVSEKQDPLIEAVIAHAIADGHFRRKQHAGVSTQDERVAYLVSQYGDQFLPSALSVIEAVRVAGYLIGKPHDWREDADPVRQSLEYPHMALQCSRCGRRNTDLGGSVLCEAA